jgi:redox-sensitive bicupin YhaK (pirin superfamily)
MSATQPQQLTGQNKDLGDGFIVRRMLPNAKLQAIGPFVFFDHFGPFTVKAGANHDVRPHPHIGLATVTYLFDGAIMHRDSLGSEQRIAPGAINWMTAGRGIVHSERGPADLKTTDYVNHGIQLWAALPAAFEEVEPEFEHTPAADIPELKAGDADVRVLIGTAFGRTSPVKTYAPTVYLDIFLPPGGTLELPALAPEVGVYAIDHGWELDGEAIAAHTLVVLPGAARLSAPEGARLMLVGGEPLDAHRFIWWNFVSSRKDRIQQAGADWANQAMGQVPGEVEFIPLPERKI